MAPAPSVETTVAQKRSIYSRGRSVVYEISSTVTQKGDLPDDGIFVYQIVQRNDAGQDKYTRVATVSDLLDYQTDRPTAVARGDEYFRNSAASIEYSNAQVAQTAVGLLDDLINNLVVNYITYSTEFSTDAELGPPAEHALTTFPLAAASLKESLINDYETVVTQREDKEAEIVVKTAGCSSLAAELAQLESERTQITDIRMATVGLKSLFTPLASQLTTFFTGTDLAVGSVENGITAFEADIVAGSVTITATSRAFFRDPTPGSIGETNEGIIPPILDSLTSSTALAKAALNALLNQETLVDQKIAAFDALLVSKDIQIDAKRTESETCSEEFAVLNQELSTLVLAEATALAAVQAVCPDYTP